MTTDERLQLGDERGVEARVEVRLDPLLQHAEAQVLESVDLRLGELLHFRVGESRTPPERKRLAKEQRAGGRLGGVCLAGKLLEGGEIELACIQLEEVARGPRVQLQIRLQQLAKLRNRVLQRRRRRLGRMLAPELIDETLGRDRSFARRSRSVRRAR
jgi:hypothetical protein